LKPSQKTVSVDVDAHAQLERMAQMLQTTFSVKASRGSTLKLVMRSEGVEIALPRGYRLSDALAFVKSQLPWLRKHLDAQKSLLNRRDEHFNFSESGPNYLPIFGTRHDVLMHGAGAPFDWQRDASLSLLCKPVAPLQVMRKQLLNALSAILVREVSHDVRVVSDVLQVHPRKVSIKAMESRWGSLGPSNSMNINFALVFAPRDALHYVIAHELSHVLERNHSDRFWAHVRRACPRFEGHHDWLQKQHGYLMGLQTSVLGG
jgi:predicted metal-dependent hydrolase